MKFLAIFVLLLVTVINCQEEQQSIVGNLIPDHRLTQGPSENIQGVRVNSKTDILFDEIKIEPEYTSIFYLKGTEPFDEAGLLYLFSSEWNSSQYFTLQKNQFYPNNYSLLIEMFDGQHNCNYQFDLPQSADLFDDEWHSFFIEKSETGNVKFFLDGQYESEIEKDKCTLFNDHAENFDSNYGFYILDEDYSENMFFAIDFYGRYRDYFAPTEFNLAQKEKTIKKQHKTHHNREKRHHQKHHHLNRQHLSHHEEGKIRLINQKKHN